MNSSFCYDDYIQALAFQALEMYHTREVAAQELYKAIKAHWGDFTPDGDEYSLYDVRYALDELIAWS